MTIPLESLKLAYFFISTGNDFDYYFNISLKKCKLNIENLRKVTAEDRRRKLYETLNRNTFLAKAIAEHICLF